MHLPCNQRPDMRRLTLAALMALSLLSSLLLASPADAATIKARSLLFKLAQQAEAGSRTYERSKFTHWIDADADSCDTREEVLIKESLSHHARGRLQDPVRESGRPGTTGGPGPTRPTSTSTTWCALKEAWESGARGCETATKRKEFANDLRFGWSLDAVTDNVNQSKGDQDPPPGCPLPSDVQVRHPLGRGEVPLAAQGQPGRADQAGLDPLRQLRLNGTARTISNARGHSPTPAAGKAKKGKPRRRRPPTIEGTDPRFSLLLPGHRLRLLARTTEAPIPSTTGTPTPIATAWSASRKRREREEARPSEWGSGLCSAVMMVGDTGLEPVTSSVSGKRATRLRQSPRGRAFRALRGGDGI